MLIQVNVNGGGTQAEAWITTNDIRRYNAQGNAAGIAGAAGYSFWVQGSFVRIRIPSGHVNNARVQITEYALGYVAPSNDMFFSSRNLPDVPADPLVHFGGLRANRGLSQIRFDRDDISTVDWTDFQTEEQEFTVANVPSDESQRLYFAVPEDPQLSRRFFHGSERIDFSVMFERLTRTISGVPYVVYLQTAETAITSNFNGVTVFAGGDE